MASSNIKLFDENKGNMLSDSEFSISNQRMNGLQTGVASSQLQNKAMYQASLVAYAIAQIMMQNGLNANDTDAVSAFVANLSGTMLQKVYDLATTAEAQAGVATGKWMSPALVKAAIDKTLTDKNYLQKSGGTMTGNLILNANPTVNLGAATKQYVDSSINTLSSNLKSVKLLDLAIEGLTSNSTAYTYSILQTIKNFNKIVVYILNALRSYAYSSGSALKLFGSNDTYFNGNIGKEYGACYVAELIKDGAGNFDGLFAGNATGRNDNSLYILREIHIASASVNNDIVVTTPTDASMGPSSFRLLVYGYKNV